VVGILEKVSSLEVKRIDIIQYPKMINYGQMIDYCQNFSYCFSSCKIYGIIGECGSGGWALSYTIAGKEKLKNGEIKINDNLVDVKELQKYSFYVGEGISNVGIRKNSIFKQLQTGIKTSGRKDYSVEDIIELFGLSKDRLNYKIEELSWERWRASLAIGFAYGKRIYCFPWCNTSFVNDLIINPCIYRCFEILKQDGAIILLPTGTQEGVEYFVDEVVHLNNSRSLPSQKAMEIVKNLKR
jgi:ABC-type dipeptide/oligopeptide/nickel transport system ATPase subunit